MQIVLVPGVALGFLALVGARGAAQNVDPAAEASHSGPDEVGDTEGRTRQSDSLSQSVQLGSGHGSGFPVFFRDADNSLGLQLRFQGRSELEVPAEESSRSTSYAFSLPLARVALAGSAYTSALGYRFEADFGSGSVSLTDYYLDYRFNLHVLGTSPIRFRVGQFKKPFTREQIARRTDLQFTDRSMVDAALGNGRDVGVLLHNGLVSWGDTASTDWAIGVFNGTGAEGRFDGVVESDPMEMTETVTGEFSNVPSKLRPTLVARVGRKSADMEAYREGDQRAGGLRGALAASTMVNLGGGSDPVSAHGGLDAMLKYRGTSATAGVFASLEGADLGGASYRGFAAFAQAGHRISKRYEPAIRYAVLIAKDAPERHEMAAAFSVLEFYGGVRWQTEVATFVEDGFAAASVRARTQLQLDY